MDRPDVAVPTQVVPPAAPIVHPLVNTQNFRLLVVDDDLSSIQQLGKLLTGYAHVSFATSGDDALSMAAAQSPDLILLDAEMPGLSGFEVFKALQADPRTAGIPVVFATSHTEPEVEAAALRLGAADFISKPFVASQVLARVRIQLQRRDVRQALASQPLTRRPRLLIVDDDTAEIQLLQSALAGFGDCYFALDGARALEMAATLAPDLLLLDIDMPGHDGFEVCRRLKTGDRRGEVLVAFITQHANASNEALAFACGADDFIGKPFATSVMLARVRRLVARRFQMDAEIAAVQRRWQYIGEARVAEIVGAASDAIVSADVHGRVVLANAAACRLFGVAAGEPVGRPLAEFLPGSAQESGAFGLGRQQATCADGSTVTVELSMSGAGTGPDMLRTYVLRDTTERDRVEAEARERSAGDAARRATADMLAFIAHELGNSLNAILGVSALALRDETAPLPSAQVRRVGLITQAAQRLQALMRDVIDLNRLEAGRFRVECQRLDPALVVQAVCAELLAQSGEAGVTLHQDVPSASVSIHADPGRLHQCLSNLVSNAIKYGGRGRPVEVAVKARDGQLHISVCDSGPGLSEQQLAHLFEPYNRLGQDGGKLPGTGLGLLLTRELAHAMGGRLQVDSQAGAGSCFTLCFDTPALQD